VLCNECNTKLLPAEVQSLEGIDVAKKIVAIAEDKQAGDILLLATRCSCSFADYFAF
jgi:predicted TPR repeat methyltransferase